MVNYNLHHGSGTTGGLILSFIFFLADFPGTKTLAPTDVLVDGFIARMFKPGDANHYFTLLLRTQHFIQYYGIVYHRGAWFITHNVNLVQGNSPGVPLQTTPLLDHSIRATYGTVVPQRRWMPADEVDVRRHVQGAVLQLPVFFVNRNGSIGFPLLDILSGCNRDLRNANDFATLGGVTTTHIRINVSLSLNVSGNCNLKLLAVAWL
jgi:hypothetical protein